LRESGIRGLAKIPLCTAALFLLLPAFARALVPRIRPHNRRTASGISAAANTNREVHLSSLKAFASSLPPELDRSSAAARQENHRHRTAPLHSRHTSKPLMSAAPHPDHEGNPLRPAIASASRRGFPTGTKPSVAAHRQSSPQLAARLHRRESSGASQACGSLLPRRNCRGKLLRRAQSCASF